MSFLYLVQSQDGLAIHLRLPRLRKLNLSKAIVDAQYASDGPMRHVQILAWWMSRYQIVRGSLTGIDISLRL